MRKLSRKLLSMVLALCLCVSSALPAMALGETNSAGVSFSLVLSESTLEKSDQDQTVTLTLKASQIIDIVDMEYDLVCNEAFTVSEPTTPAGTAAWNANSKHMSWMASSDVSTDTLGTTTVTIPANTQAGTYEFKVAGITLINNAEDFEETDAYATAILTITDGSGEEEDPIEPTTGYTVEVANSSSDLVAVDGTVTLNVNVNNVFNSAMIKLSYDTSYLTFVGGTVASNQTMGEKDQAVSITDNNGTITIIDYGTAFTAGTAYTLTFTAKAGTAGTNVTVTSAGLSTQEKAEVENLTAATTLGNVSVPVGYSVTVPSGEHTFTASADTVVPGGSVTVTPINPYYTYELEATGGTIAYDSESNTWTVSNVTGNVIVTVKSATAKSFDVTIKTVDKDGNPIDGIVDAVTTNGATYGVNYVYTLPADTEAGLAAGVQYTLKSITVGGNAATYSTSDRTYTINGANVTGDIIVTITKQDLDPSAFTVTVNGDGASAGSLTAAQVAKGNDAVLTLSNKEKGYTYTVTATMGGEDVNVTVTGDVYTVSNVTGNVVFTITKTLDTTSLIVSEYVQLDGKTMWLVKIGSEQISGKTYQYSANTTGENFYWSTKYGNGTYCFLIITDTNTDAETVKADVAGKLSLVDAAAISIGYTGNVNGSSAIDVNDAQLVWNMYSAVYGGFTENVTVQKFLEADMDYNGSLSTSDAAVVVGKIPAN